MNKDKIYKVLVFILFGIVFISSFYKLGDIPNFINVDEAGTILNAQTLKTFGTDRYGIVNPIYPNNYYGGQSILATLLVMPFLKNILYSRIPYATIRCICSIYVFLTLNNRKERIVSLFLFAIFPVFIMSSRFILDCDLMLYILIISVYYLFDFFKNRKTYNLFLSGIFFGLAFYTYALSYIYIPLIIVLLIIYVFIYEKDKFTIKELVIFIFPIIIMGIPLLIRILVDLNYIGSFSFLGITFNKIISNRAADINIKNFSIVKIIDVFKYTFIKDRYKTLSYGFGGPCLYLPMAFVIIFFIQMKKKKYIQKVFLSIMFITALLIGLFLDEANTWRFNYIYIPIMYMSAISISEYNSKTICYIAAVYVCLFSIFTYNYLFIYGKQYDSVMQDNGLYEAYRYAKEFNKDIYVEDSRLGEEYVYYFLFDENVDLKDYPKEYYPKTIYDSKNNRTIYLEFNNVDPNAMYFVFNITDDVKDNYKYIKQFGSWSVCYN